MSSSLLFACTDSSTSPGLASPATAAPAIGVASTCDPNNGSLELPAGFCARVFSEGVFNARQMAITPHGDLYVAVDTVPNPDVRGGIVALRDANGDGRAEMRRFFGATGGNGIAWRNGQRFFATETEVVRWDLPSGTFLPPQTETVVVTGLTGGGDHHRKTGLIGVGRTPISARHRAVGLAQGPDGSLYISDDKGGFIWRVFYVGSGSTSP